jgi:hypothetical protein
MGLGALRTALRLRSAYRMMKSDFLPAAPDFRKEILSAILNEPLPAGLKEPDPVSLRSWFAVALVIVSSLVLAPFGGDFIKMASLLGSDLLLPVAITLGMFMSLFSALLIGSHLKELKTFFGMSQG